MSLKKEIERFRERLKLRAYGGCRELFEQRDADIFIVSYPKSGRTWLRLMLGKYLADLSEIEFTELLEIYQLTDAAKNLPKIGVVHDGSSLDGTNWKACRLKKNKAFYKNRKVVFLARDPRDVAVSYFFHCNRRAKAYQKGISDFLRDEKFGLPKIIRFMNIWAMNRAIPKAFLLVHYEKLLANPAAELKRFIEFIGVKYDAGLVGKAVEFASFEKMREMELQGKFESDRLKPGCPGDPESFKTRKGKTAGYTDYLVGDDLEYANEMIKNNLSPFFGYQP